MELKQAIVIRTDLEMGKGKMCAQAAHASISAYKKCPPKIRDEWERSGMKKIVLKVNSESGLMKCFQECVRAGIPSSLIHDAGLTQIPSGSPTCFGAGPADSEAVDRILGELKLL
ncbi:MAG TPA: peptidyl-tRNA hydrolase Pth2 [Candidatus Bilamarchaeaceae archaeon]|nr:peptidyl-tRNA hydrolase Pth2 [Candidatus Bilamarchaeaceae archaeon]